MRRSLKMHVKIEAAVTAAVVSVGAVALAVNPASPAAAAGRVPVGAKPVDLVQPTDPFIGRAIPSGTADETGMYSEQVDWPLVAIHTALLPSGHVLTYGSPLGGAQQSGLIFDDWNPAGAHNQTESMHAYDGFCNALTVLPDGNVLMVGGNSTTSSMIYNPDTQAQTMGEQLNDQRWYSTVLRLPDDRILTLGGGDSYYNAQDPDDEEGVGIAPEIGTGTGPWTVLTGAKSKVAFGAKDNRWWYPRAYVAPDGTVFGVSFDQMWRLDTDGTGSVESLGTLPDPIGVSGSSVMYAPGKLLFAGGGQHREGSKEAATDAITLVDISAATPKVTPIKPMATARNWLNLTMLDNGEVFANGGTKVGNLTGADNSAYTAEIWNAGTGQWRSAATAQRIRTYHSTSLRLPSGAVLTAGGGLPGPETNFNAEIYYPPHLFSRDSDGIVQWADRPEIRTISGSAAYGGTLKLGMKDDREIASASLTSLGSVTHSLNTDQRHIPLMSKQNGTTVNVDLPKSPNTMPPGSYLLSTVSKGGLSTPSQIITIQQDGTAGTVTILDGDEATEPASVPLTGDHDRPGNDHLPGPQGSARSAHRRVGRGRALKQHRRPGRLVLPHPHRTQA